MEGNSTLIFCLYAAGLVLSGLLYVCRLGRQGENRLCAPAGMILGILLACAGAKLFFLMQHMGLDIGSWSADTVFSAAWEEFSFAGGCLGFMLGIWTAAKILHISGGKALDLFAVPGCILIAFARMAEAGMENIGQGNMPAFLPEVFPFAVKDDWGDAFLAVFTLEALAALLCAAWLVFDGRKRKDGFSGQFRKAVIVLCGAQLFLEMLVTNYWITFMISFIHMDQVICAVILLIMVIRGCVRNKKAGPVIVTVLLLGLNALTQYIQDKPYVLSLPDTLDVGALALAVFALCSAGLIAAGLRAVRDNQSQLTSSKGS